MRALALCVVALACGTSPGAAIAPPSSVDAASPADGAPPADAPPSLEVTDTDGTPVDTDSPRGDTDTAPDDTDALPDTGAPDDTDAPADADAPIEVSPPQAGPAGPCTSLAVLGCGDHVDGSLGAVSEGIATWGCALWPPLEHPPSPENTVTVWSPVPSHATVTVSRDLTASGSILARVVDAAGSSCVPGSCRSFTSRADVTLDGETPVFVAVESWLGEQGDWSLDVTCCTPGCDGRVCGDDGCGGLCGECALGGTCLENGTCAPCAGAGCSCAPACGGKVCGPDGCGGSCGACATGQACTTAGTCVAPSYQGNDTCATATPIPSLPFEGLGATVGAADDLSPNGDPNGGIVPLDGCVRTEPGGRDVVFRYTATAPTTLLARLDTLTDGPCGGAGEAPCPPAVLYAASSCPVAACLDAVDFLWRGARPLRVTLAAGETVYWVVEGHTSAEAGAFRLSVVAAP